jgi:peptidoglycan-N-acetylglucosamine deacetylase
MRVVVIVVAALATLSLAVFGVVAAQRANAPQSVLALQTAPAPKAVPVTAPVSQIAQAPVTQPVQPTAAAPASSEPIRLAQNGTPAGSMTPERFQQMTAPAGSTASAAPASTAAPSAIPAAGPAPAAATAHPITACDKPGGLGLSRIVEIDTTGGPAFGTEHFKQYDFLRDKEVVLTFDDGPWPDNTPMVLKALQDNCLKATFFEIGEHATWRPDLSRQLAEAGMTIGSHTWSHKDLAKKPYATDIEQAKQEIEMGVSAVHMAVNGPIAPFFRFPDLQMPADLIAYLGTRNIATFSTDIDTFDFKLHKPEQVVKSVMDRLAKNGKGILLMHDFQHATAEAMPEILRQLKAGGYKIVHMVPKQPAETLAKYDDMVRAQDKFSSSNNTRPENSVVKTISE